MAFLKLEVFDTEHKKPPPAPVPAEVSAQDDARLQSYEQGYSAGWEDATNAQAEDQTRVRADLARNIQMLGFTYHEAREHVLQAVAPLLQEMVARLLPEMARAALAPVVLETLMPLAADMADAPISLVMNPAARPAIEALLEQATGLPLTVVEEPTLGEGQVYLRLGDTEVRVDLDRAVSDITAALRGFFGHAESEDQNG